MKDFLHRNVTEESTELGLSVSRMRTSTGFCSITIVGNGNKLQFSNESEGVADPNYEEKVRELANMMLKIADEPCLLPGQDIYREEPPTPEE